MACRVGIRAAAGDFTRCASPRRVKTGDLTHHRGAFAHGQKEQPFVAESHAARPKPTPVVRPSSLWRGAVALRVLLIHCVSIPPPTSSYSVLHDEYTHHHLFCCIHHHHLLLAFPSVALVSLPRPSFSSFKTSRSCEPRRDLPCQFVVEPLRSVLVCHDPRAPTRSPPSCTLPHECTRYSVISWRWCRLIESITKAAETTAASCLRNSCTCVCVCVCMRARACTRI